MTLGAVLKQVMTRLTPVCGDEARLEARMILCHVLDVELSVLIGYPERLVRADDQAKIEDMVKRREGREPLSQILGQREFWSLPFKVTADTLTPRPDSETIIEAVLGGVPDQQAALKVLDLGTGTGCLLLSLLHEYTNAIGVGVDLSAQALDVAKENAESLGLKDRATLLQGSWFDPLTSHGPFDVIVSNPPYIANHERATLQPEVRDFDPDLALFGGADGLDPYRVIAAQATEYLADDGVLVVEFGQNQHDAVQALMQAQGLVVRELVKDLTGIIRCAIIYKN